MPGSTSEQTLRRAYVQETRETLYFEIQLKINMKTAALTAIAIQTCAPTALPPLGRHGSPCRRFASALSIWKQQPNSRVPFGGRFPPHGSSQCSALGICLAAPAVKPDRPRVDRVGLEMRPAPRIARESRVDNLFRLSLDDEDYAMFVGERSPQHNEARLHESIHEGRMGGPVGLLLQRTRRIPLTSGTVPDDKERCHLPVIPLLDDPLAHTPFVLPREHRASVRPSERSSSARRTASRTTHGHMKERPEMSPARTLRTLWDKPTARSLQQSPRSSPVSPPLILGAG